MEYFEDRKNCLGVFATISGRDLDPSEIYEEYKSREKMEQTFDTMRVILNWKRHIPLIVKTLRDASSLSFLH